LHVGLTPRRSPLLRSTQRMHLRKILPLVTGTLLLAALTPACADGPGDADKLLTSAQEAYTQKNFPVAVTHFREVLSKYPATPSAAAAKFGLAVCLIEGHDKKYDEALKLLTDSKADEKEIDSLQIVYYRGAALRGKGV